MGFLFIINATEQQLNYLFLQLFITRVSVLKSTLKSHALQVRSEFQVWISLRKIYFKTLEEYSIFYSLWNPFFLYVRIDLVYSDYTVKAILIFYSRTLKPRNSTHLNFYRKCILTLQVYQIFQNQQVLQTEARLEIPKLQCCTQ